MQVKWSPTRVSVFNELLVRDLMQGIQKGPYSIENWYEKLKEFTFKTNFIPLDLDEAIAISKYKEITVLFSRIQMQEMSNPNTYAIADWMNGAPLTPDITPFISEEEKSVISKLTHKLENAVQSVGGTAFIKLSSRSPKDSALGSKKMRRILKEIITSEEIPASSPQEEDIRNIQAFTKGCQLSLQVTSGHEAFSLMAMSNRVSQDINMYRLHNGEENFQMNIVAREWNNIPTIWEFRTIVFNYEITVITHYYSNCYVPEIAEREEEIVSRIREAFKIVHPLVNLADYTIDFCLDPNSDKFWVIEINNPPPVAGVSFLTYENPEDKEVITKGPFGFYCNRKPLENPYDGIEPILHRYMLHLRNRLREIEEIGIHPGVRCNLCGMDPIIGERFCCIECGGGVFDCDQVNNCTLVLEHPEKFNICCFCYCDRVHDPSHHYLVYIVDKVLAVSKFSTIPIKEHEPIEEPLHVPPPVPSTSTWCTLV